MTTKEMIEVMQAYVDGKEIEEMCLSDPYAEWRVNAYPLWDWFNMLYRIKP